MESIIYIGSWKSDSGTQDHRHNWFISLARAEGKMWVRDKLKEYLPPKGEAYYPNAGHKRKNDIAVLTVKKNPRETAEQNHDDFIVEKVLTVREIYDYRDKCEQSARHDFVDIGVEGNKHINRNIVIALPNNKCIVTNLHFNDITNRYHSAKTVALHHFDDTVFQGETVYKIYYEIPDVTVGRLIENKRNWKDDRELLNEVLRSLKKWGSDGPSRSEIQYLESVLNKAQTYTIGRPEWVNLKEWINHYLPRIEEYLNAPGLIAKFLIENSFVDEKMAISRDKLKIEMTKSIKAELREEVDGYKQAIVVQSEILADLLNEQEELELIISKLKQKIRFEVAKLNQAIGSGSSNSETKAELVASLNTVLEGQDYRVFPVDNNIPPWTRVRHDAGTAEISFPNLRKKLRRTARSIALESKEMEFFDIAMRAGTLTILPQDCAELMIPAYSNVVAGGQFIREALGPHILTLDDLWIKPSYKEQTGFARAWEDASFNPSKPVVLWLDGIQRSSMGLWLPSLIGVLNSVDRPNNLFIVASINVGFFEHENIPRQNLIDCSPIFPSIDVDSWISGEAFSMNNTNETTLLSMQIESEIDIKDIRLYLYSQKHLLLTVASVLREKSLLNSARQLVGNEDEAVELLNEFIGIRKHGCDELKKLLD